MFVCIQTSHLPEAKYVRVCVLFSFSYSFWVELVHLPPFEEGHIEDGCIGIHELQEESLQNQTLLKVGLCFRDLCRHISQISWVLDKYVLDELQTITKACIVTSIIKRGGLEISPNVFLFINSRLKVEKLSSSEDHMVEFGRGLHVFWRSLNLHLPQQITGSATLVLAINSPYFINRLEKEPKSLVKHIQA